MISSFSGKYHFLSNFHAHQILHKELWWPTVEHAFQAMKSADTVDWEHIRRLATPGDAKRAGRKLVLRLDWEQVKDGIMLDLLRIKFEHGTELATKLDATGDEELVEINHWNDRYWGVCNGVGQNKLGKLLMQVREGNRQK